MTALDVTTEAPVRCAPWTREQGVDPIGSMGIYRSFLLVEWPLPWPKDLGDVPALGELRADLAAAGCRLQGLVPPGHTVRRSVVYYRAPEGPFRSFLRTQLTVDPGEVIDAARALLAGEGPEPAEVTSRDVLVCTHGNRDRCCGSLGTALALELLADPGFLGPQARLWRTSHTGGHRFAPTALVFPEGTGWAFADTTLLARVVARQGPIAEVLKHYRGCAGLVSPPVQAVERAVLGRVGWDLFDRPRWGSAQADGTVRLHVEGPGSTTTWEAKVSAGRVLPVPECGAPVTQARKQQTELAVGSLRQVS